MEEPNVNRLNGIPNFGHGFPEEQVQPVEPSEETNEAPVPEEPVELPNNIE